MGICYARGEQQLLYELAAAGGVISSRQYLQAWLLFCTAYMTGIAGQQVQVQPDRHAAAESSRCIENLWMCMCCIVQPEDHTLPVCCNALAHAHVHAEHAAAAHLSAVHQHVGDAV